MFVPHIPPRPNALNGKPPPTETDTSVQSLPSRDLRRRRIGSSYIKLTCARSDFLKVLCFSPPPRHHSGEEHNRFDKPRPQEIVSVGASCRFTGRAFHERGNPYRRLLTYNPAHRRAYLICFCPMCFVAVYAWLSGGTDELDAACSAAHAELGCMSKAQQ